ACRSRLVITQAGKSTLTRRVSVFVRRARVQSTSELTSSPASNLSSNSRAFIALNFLLAGTTHRDDACHFAPKRPHGSPMTPLDPADRKETRLVVCTGGSLQQPRIVP